MSSANESTSSAYESTRDPLPKGYMYPLRLRVVVDAIAALGLRQPYATCWFHRRVYRPPGDERGWPDSMQLVDLSRDPSWERQQAAVVAEHPEFDEPTIVWVDVFSIPSKAARDAGLTHERVAALLQPVLRQFAEPLTHGQSRRASVAFLPAAGSVEWEIMLHTYGTQVVEGRGRVGIE